MVSDCLAVHHGDVENENGLGPIAVVGLFTVEPGRQEELIEAINFAGEVMRNKPGFLGSTLVASLDGTRVINYSAWRSTADLHAAREDPAGVEAAERMFAIAVPEPIQGTIRAELTAS